MISLGKIRTRWLGVTFLLALAVVLAACGTAAEAPSDEEREPIRIADRQWQTMWINNAIAQFIIEHGYEYPVEIQTMSTPIWQQTVETGEWDIDMELWEVNIIDWYDKVVADGKLVNLGPTFDESAQGFYVPRYVIEGDSERGIEPMAPDLQSVADLKEYWHVFEDPDDAEKGVFINCIIGWECAKHNMVRLHAYGLADRFTVVEPGAAAALDAAIAGAYQRGEPLLAYYWEPTWLMGQLDMVRLEEPPFTDACNAIQQRALDDQIPMDEVPPEAACAFQSFAVNKGINPDLEERAPEVVDFLRAMNVGTDNLSQTAAYMQENETSEAEAAIWYFENFPERWRDWLPADIESKVEEALREAGAEL